MDQHETWHAGRPGSRPDCVRWGTSSTSPKAAQTPQFSVHICCGQMTGWIKMPLGMEVGLGPGDFVLDENPSPFPKRGQSPLPNFGPTSIVAKRLHGSRWHLLARRWASDQATLCSMATQLNLPKKGAEPHNLRRSSSNKIKNIIILKLLYFYFIRT